MWLAATAFSFPITVRIEFKVGNLTTSHSSRLRIRTVIAKVFWFRRLRKILTSSLLLMRSDYASWLSSAMEVTSWCTMSLISSLVLSQISWACTSIRSQYSLVCIPNMPKVSTISLLLTSRRCWKTKRRAIFLKSRWVILRVDLMCKVAVVALLNTSIICQRKTKLTNQKKDFRTIYLEIVCLTKVRLATSTFSKSSLESFTPKYNQEIKIRRLIIWGWELNSFAASKSLSLSTVINSTASIST